MKVYRIAKKKFIKDLEGTGAKLFGGRWNPKGIAVLYSASNRSLAALEYLVHMELNIVPDDIKIIELELPDSSIIEFGRLKFKRIIGKKNAPKILKTEGFNWIKSSKSLALAVPSILISEESNILINPAHKDFKKLKIKSTKDFQFDERLFK